MSRTFIFLFLVCTLGLSVSAQVAPVAQTKDEARPLTPGLTVESQIAGGESHTYQITLQAGQFVRVGLQPTHASQWQ